MANRLNIIDAANVSAAQIELEADAVIVGSGAGGAVCAYELAAAGKRVVVLEAGPYVPSEEFTERYTEMIERLYADAGGQTNAAGDLMVLQGACVGGSTVVNAAACFRTPESILHDWVTRFGLVEFTPEKLRPYFEKVERRLSVHVNQPHEINENSKLLAAGCAKLGYSSRPVARNVKDCALTGFCLAGCATDRKQSMLVTYIPWALAKGAQVYADTRVDEILTEGGRAVGVRGVMRDRASGAQKAAITVRAKTVVLSAGAVQTPVLLLKNRLANRSGQVGRNFACHPSLGIMARFEHEVYGYKGATIGLYCDEFEAPEKGGFILEAGMVGADFVAIGAPGFGAMNVGFMQDFNRIAGLVSLIHDENVGRIEWDDETGKKIHYELAEKDKEVIRRCMIAGAKILFAAGAREVVLPTYAPAVIHGETEIERVVAGLTLEPHTLRLTSYHPQGTCRMGADPEATVVSPSGETHDVAGLFVADASLFPTSIMVNPQISVYALATFVAEHVLAKLG